VQFVLLYGPEAWTLKQDDEKCLQTFRMKAQRCILQISWYDFITNDSMREQTKLVDPSLVVADRRHANLGHIIRLPEETLLIPCYSMLSTSLKVVTLQKAGSIHPVDHGKHGYNKSSHSRTVTFT